MIVFPSIRLVPLLLAQIIGVFMFNYAQITLYPRCYIIVLRRDARLPLSARVQAFRQDSSMYQIISTECLSNPLIVSLKIRIVRRNEKSI